MSRPPHPHDPDRRPLEDDELVARVRRDGSPEAADALFHSHLRWMQGRIARRLRGLPAQAVRDAQGEVPDLAFTYTLTDYQPACAAATRRRTFGSFLRLKLNSVLTKFLEAWKLDEASLNHQVDASAALDAQALQEQANRQQDLWTGGKSPDPAVALAWQEILARLWQEVQQLSDTDRRLCELLAESVPSHQTAQTLGLERHALLRRARRLFRQLRAKLRPSLGG
jgi:DNA-binding CsgD family transcriptional regulator